MPAKGARNQLRGCSLDTLLADVETAADFALVHSYGGYTTNLPLEDRAWGRGAQRVACLLNPLGAGLPGG